MLVCRPGRESQEEGKLIADPLFRNKLPFVRVTWVAVALALVFVAFLSVQSCFPEPKIAALSWAEESRISSQSLIPSSKTIIAVAKQAKASVVNVSLTTKVNEGQGFPEAPSPFFDDPFFRRFFGEELDRCRERMLVSCESKVVS